MLECEISNGFIFQHYFFWESVMRRENMFLRKLSELSYCNKAINRKILHFKKSWDEIYKIINCKDKKCKKK